MIEEWKEIKGYEGLYQVSNFGRVKSLYFKKEKILKPHSTKGYLTVRLYKNKIGKDFYIHCLVMDTFSPNEDKTLERNHIDEDKTNNRLDNLEWVSHKENINSGTVKERIRNSQLGEKSIRSKQVLCVELNQVFGSLREVERQLNIPATNISKACKGIYKTAGGYHWEYCDQKKRRGEI